MHIEKGRSLLANCFSASTHISILNNSLKTHLQSLLLLCCSTTYKLSSRGELHCKAFPTQGKLVTEKQELLIFQHHCKNTNWNFTSLVSTKFVYSNAFYRLYCLFLNCSISSNRPIGLCGKTHNPPICTLQHTRGRNKPFFNPLCNHS